MSDANLANETALQRARLLTGFLERYLPKFRRVEQRKHATRVVGGLLGALERKSCAAIAIQSWSPRRAIQFFVGAGKWDDESVMAELRAHVREGRAEPDGVVVINARAFPKKGTQSCGAARQSCGVSREVDNCQVGIFLSYASSQGCAPLDRRLYLPESWADSTALRVRGHVPPEVTYLEKWQIALALLDRSLTGLRHGWITGDVELGRSAEFRAALRRRGERYILDVPGEATVRDLQPALPAKQPDGGDTAREMTLQELHARAQGQPDCRWVQLSVRAGQTRPLLVDAMMVPALAAHDARIEAEERLVAIRTEGEPGIVYALTNAGAPVPLAELIRAQQERQRIDELFAAGEREAGLGHYEVRSWVGWHHHMTLALLALWFVCLERQRSGAEKPGGDLLVTTTEQAAEALEIPRDLHDAMVAHCVRESPLECCGILGGVMQRVSSFHPLRNAAGSQTRYDADPRDLLDAVVALRARGAGVLAIYHSHPRWTAIPSRTDLQENYWGPVPRIIVSLVGESPQVRVWRLDADSYTELPWRIV